MQRLKSKWEITHNWQLIFIALGIIGLIACAYFIANRITTAFFKDSALYIVIGAVLTLLFSLIIYKLCMWLFTKLYDRWEVSARWELIAIFIVFAITGSLSARLSAPLLDLIGLEKEAVNPWIFWPLRLLIIFPIYQVLLVVMGYIFGQFTFFWKFEKKMLSRFGINL